MPAQKKNDSVIAICIQEPFEDGSSMDFGPAIQGDELRFLHQAFITDTIKNALEVNKADVRLYYIDLPERKRRGKRRKILKAGSAVMKWRKNAGASGLKKLFWIVSKPDIKMFC